MTPGTGPFGLIIVATWLLVVGAAAAGCGASGQDASSPDRAAASENTPPDPGVVHVHGLGINPKDGALFAATHTGLFRIADGKAERVGDRYQDTMGFTVIGPDHFLGSGHPDVRDYTAGRLPGLLGLVESKDAGLTWKPQSLLGKVDFHTLSSAHGQIYGFDSTGGRFMLSKNGKDWDTKAQVNLLSFAVNPSQAEFIIGATPTGLQVTKNGGSTWGPVNGPNLVLLGWPESGLLFGVEAKGAVYRSADGGSTWAQQGSLPGSAEAFLATNSRLFAAVQAGGIYTSDDLGANWSIYYRQGSKEDL